MASHPEPPGPARKIVEKDFSYLRNLDLQGWLKELERISRHLFGVDHPLASRSLPLQRAGLMWNLFEDGAGLHTIRLGIRTVRLLEPRVVTRKVNGKQRSVRLDVVSPYELPALLVHLDAPDDVIMTQFKAALKEARKRYPAPVAKPGRNALSARFTKRTFTVWLNYKIVQLAELLTWRALLGEEEQKKYPNTALGGWLGFDDKKMSLAMGCLEKAVTGIPALATQIAGKASKERKSKN
jgi:hypothetical protein